MRILEEVPFLYRQLGCGLNETSHQSAMDLEMQRMVAAVGHRVHLPNDFKGQSHI